MSEDKLSHLWIPDEEVEAEDLKASFPPDTLVVDHAEHGGVLSSGLKSVMDAYTHLQDDVLKDEDIMIFQMVLQEDQDISAQRKIAESEGMNINAVKDKHHAVVSTNKTMFQRLQERVGRYRESGALKYFKYVDAFAPISLDEKESRALKLFLEQNKEQLHVDVQVMFTPNLPEDMIHKATEGIMEKFNKAVSERGNITFRPMKYSLADGTPVIRADVPVDSLRHIVENNRAIYRVEQTGFFHSNVASAFFQGRKLTVDPSINIDELPNVVVLDSGVRFPDDMAALVPIHWKASGVSGIGNQHGTAVASKVVFSHIGTKLKDQYLVPRAKVIDCDIYGDSADMSQDEMSNRIAEAVEAFHDVAKIYNLSSNMEVPIDPEHMSIIGTQIDALSKKYGVKFVISAGNHDLAKVRDNIADIIDDDDSRIAEPADAMLGITVGAIAGVSNDDAFSRELEPTAYTRFGPGFFGFFKPDLVAFGANITKDLQLMRTDPYAIMLAPEGRLCIDAGTSFTAPVIAGDLADLTTVVPNNDIPLAQALLYNGAFRFFDDKNVKKAEAKYTAKQYGRGLSDPENCKYSSPNRVTFMRTGSLKIKTKEHVRFPMPEIQAQAKGNGNTRVTITCLTDAPIDQSKGPEYLGASITVQLFKRDKDGKLTKESGMSKDNNDRWDTCFHFTKVFSRFFSGVWEVQLDLHSRWLEKDIEDIEIPYAMVVTIEDLTQENDIYSAVVRETGGRYQPISSIRIPVRG